MCPEESPMMRLDPIGDEGKSILDILEEVYQKAYDKTVGPIDFRHADYHRMALLAVYNYIREEK